MKITEGISPTDIYVSSYVDTELTAKFCMFLFTGYHRYFKLNYYKLRTQAYQTDFIRF